MLINFEVENYKSLKDSIRIKMGEDRLLLIHGKEMSGKTNILDALACCISHITSPVQFIKKEKINFYKKCIPNFEVGNNYISFKISFNINNNLYDYSIIFEIKENIIIVEKEELKVNKKEFFKRNKIEVILCNDLKKYDLSDITDESMPYISFLALTEKDEIINTFYEFCKQVTFIDSTINSSVINDITLKYLNNEKKLVVKILKNINKNYEDYSVFEDGRIINIYRNDLKIKYEDDSLTMQNAIIYLPQIIDAVKNGKLILIDDIDKKLNANIFNAIINIVDDKNINKNNSQLIATLSDKKYIGDEKNVLWI